MPSHFGGPGGKSFKDVPETRQEIEFHLQGVGHRISGGPGRKSFKDVPEPTGLVF